MAFTCSFDEVMMGFDICIREIRRLDVMMLEVMECHLSSMQRSSLNNCAFAREGLR